MKLLLVGSSGLVGREVLRLALADRLVEEVIAPVRSEIPDHPKLLAPLVDFDELPQDADWWDVDAVICTLGTTMRAAGSREAFRKVDHGYSIEVARIARRRGAKTFVLNSAIGANTRSAFFYNRTKGELERDLECLEFRSLVLVRPGLIGGNRAEHRPMERLAIALSRALAPVLPLRWRINPSECIALALLAAALDPTPGRRLIESEKLV